MYIINVPIVKLEDDEKCVLLRSNENRFPPVPDMVNEIWKILNLMPEVKLRVTLKLKAERVLD